MSDIGHNSAPDVGGIATDRLRSIIERIERLEEEKRALSADIRDIYTEAKSAGFPVAALRAVVAERRKDAAQVQEHQYWVDLFKRALGMLDGTPLGTAAIAAATSGRRAGRRA